MKVTGAAHLALRHATRPYYSDIKYRLHESCERIKQRVSV